MIIKISGEAPFQVLASNFTISPAESAYTLQVSADGKEYSDLFAVAANITRMVTGVASGSFYRLKNNTGGVSINWRKCSGTDGSDGTANELKPMKDLPLTADEGAVAATEEGLYQYKDGQWVKIETGDGFLPLTGGTLSGNLTLGDSTTTSFKKVESIRNNDGNVNGAAFYVNSDGTASFFHKKYNGASATNDAILKFNATNGLQFAANPNGTATDFKDVLVDGKVKTINGESIVGTGDIKIEGGSNTFVITMNEETGEPDATGFNAAYEAAGGNLTVLLNVVERVIPAKEIRVENGGYYIDFAAYGDFESTGNEEVIVTYFITEDDQVSEQPMRRMTITQAFDDLDRYATRIVPITQSQYDAIPESRIQPDTLYIIID